MSKHGIGEGPPYTWYQVCDAMAYRRLQAKAISRCPEGTEEVWVHRMVHWIIAKSAKNPVYLWSLQEAVEEGRRLLQEAELLYSPKVKPGTEESKAARAELLTQIDSTIVKSAVAADAENEGLRNLLQFSGLRCIG